MIIRKLIAAACFAAGAAGCVHTDVYRVARFRPGAAAVHAPAPVSGVYRVRYATSGGDLQNLAESERIVRKGEPLGFRVAEDGTLLVGRAARDRLAREWPSFAQGDKSHCLELSRLGEPTYTELLTCLELAREARNLRERDRSTTGESR